jgi:hypothetical protein
VNLNSMMIVAAVVLGIIWFWHASMSARERANGAAREACERLRLVMLDGTVSIVRMWFRRDLAGRLRIERTYGFESTDDGYRRMKGFIVTLGPTVTSVGLAAARRAGPQGHPLPPFVND